MSSDSFLRFGGLTHDHEPLSMASSVCHLLGRIVLLPPRSKSRAPAPFEYDVNIHTVKAHMRGHIRSNASSLWHETRNRIQSLSTLRKVLHRCQVVDLVAGMHHHHRPNNEVSLLGSHTIRARSHE
jgi:hypothetical protein